MAEVSFKLKGFDLLLASIKRAGNLTPKIINDHMKQAGVIMREAGRKNVTVFRKVFTANLRKSINYQITNRGSEFVIIVGPHVPPGNAGIYAEVIHYGRIPGSKPPPLNAIMPWVLAKGIPGSEAYPIARAIGRRGLAGQPFPYMERAMEEHGQSAANILLKVADTVVIELEK